MRFFHIADVHLGMQPDKGCAWSEDRGRDVIPFPRTVNNCEL